MEIWFATGLWNLSCILYRIYKVEDEWKFPPTPKWQEV